MNTKSFLFGCIFVRFLLVLITSKCDLKYLPYLGLLALLPAVGFIVIYLGDYRKTGGEVLNGKIWWNDNRPIHASLYILFALFALKKHKHSWVPLFIDVLFGLFSFLLFYSLNDMWNKTSCGWTLAFLKSTTRANLKGTSDILHHGWETANWGHVTDFLLLWIRILHINSYDHLAKIYWSSWFVNFTHVLGYVQSMNLILLNVALN